MASFAEIDQNNVVLRVLKACSQDIENNGGSQSDQAATHFENLAPLSPLGVKWIETSKTGAFRVRHAGPGMIYNQAMIDLLLHNLLLHGHKIILVLGTPL
jgi:hypothetical protein